VPRSADRRRSPAAAHSCAPCRARWRRRATDRIGQPPAPRSGAARISCAWPRRPPTRRAPRARRPACDRVRLLPGGRRSVPPAFLPSDFLLVLTALQSLVLRGIGITATQLRRVLIGGHAIAELVFDA